MSNSFGLACPSCGSQDSIDIAALVFIRLVPDGTDCDLSRDGSHDWEDASPANCGCGWVGTVKDLNDDDQDILESCECDNTHEANDTVCRWCWGHSRRHWNDPDVPDDSGPINANEGLNP